MKNYNNAVKSIFSIILNNGKIAFEEASRYIGKEHLLKKKYLVIWDACQWLYDNDSVINKTSIIKCLDAQKEEDGNSKISYLSESSSPETFLGNIKLFANKDSVDDIFTYAKMVLDEFVVAKNIEMASRISSAKTAGQQLKIIEEYTRFWYISDTKEYQTAADIAAGLGEDAKNGISRKDKDIRNNIPVLKECLTLSPTNTTVIAGDTGHGKSSLAIQLVVDIASQQVPIIDKDTGKPIFDEDFNEIKRHRTVLFLSMEMEKSEIVGKLFCAKYNMSWAEMKKLDEKTYSKMAIEMAEILKRDMPNLVIESGEMSLSDTVKHAANVDRKFGGIDVVVYDHIGLLSDIYEHQPGHEHERYKYCSRYIKMKIAVKMNTHCILLSQLNKASIDRSGKANHLPSVDRLFGSSGIKQDATNIIFVYRENALGDGHEVIKAVIPDKNTGKLAETQIKSYFVTKLIVAKSRFGEITTPKMVGFIPYLQLIIPFSRIIEWDLLRSDDGSFRLSGKQVSQIMTLK